MRWLVIIIVACLLLTVLKAAIAVLLILLGIAVLWGVYFRPAETVGFFALMCFMSVLERYPLPVLLLIGLLGVLAYLQRPDGAQTSKDTEPKLLTHEAQCDRTSGGDP
jgi:hypothetical protein